MRFSNIFHYKPRLPTLLRQAHPLLRRGLGGSLPSFLYSFLPPSKTATSSLFVIHFTEISPSTSVKHRFLQYSSPANHDSQSYSARHIPSFGGAWGGPISSFFYSFPRLPTLLRQVHPLLRRGLGRPFFPLFFFSFGLGEALLSFFKYFRPLPHLLSNIENMSTLFFVKIPLFCPSLQQLMLQSTNSLLFICFLLYPLILSSSLSSDVYSLPVSPDHYTFL